MMKASGTYEKDQDDCDLQIRWQVNKRRCYVQECFRIFRIEQNKRTKKYS